MGPPVFQESKRDDDEEEEEESMTWLIYNLERKHLVLSLKRDGKTRGQTDCKMEPKTAKC